MKLMYLDLETTGTNSKKNGICQIAGIIKVSDQEEVVFDWYMNPGDVEIERNAMSVNGISVASMKQQPSSAEIYSKFLELMGKYVNKFDKSDKFFLIGYNIGFDFDFMRSWFESNGDQYIGSWFHYPPLDVLQVAAIKLMGKRHLLENMKLGTVYREVMGKDFEDQHNALGDIMATREILGRFFREGF